MPRTPAPDQPADSPADATLDPDVPASEPTSVAVAPDPAAATSAVATEAAPPAEESTYQPPVPGPVEGQPVPPGTSYHPPPGQQS